MTSVHTPVLLKEIISYLKPESGKNFIDCTFGAGGHSRAILNKIKPNGKILAIDLDKDVLKNFKASDAQSITFVSDNFCDLKKIVSENFKYPVHGILLDLGLSSDQLEVSGRGFSFQTNELLDMRFSTNQEMTAADILNTYPLEDLYDIFKNYGEYPHARRLSQSIFEFRKVKKFQSTQDLVEVVRGVHFRQGHEKIHPATKVFQALRIAVNDELGSLATVLPQALEILAPHGRLAVISFHAGEDRIVKNFFRDKARAEKPQIKLLTKKPIVPTEAEIKSNPRSRSAKLRVIEKL